MLTIVATVFANPQHANTFSENNHIFDKGSGCKLDLPAHMVCVIRPNQTLVSDYKLLAFICHLPFPGYEAFADHIHGDSFAGRDRLDCLVCK